MEWTAGRRDGDPSEAEIAAACAEIQLTWTPAERAKRGAWMQPQPVDVSYGRFDGVGEPSGEFSAVGD